MLFTSSLGIFADTISDHVFGMQIEVEKHFTAESSSPLGYEFDFEIATDTTVTNVTVDCPSGFTFAISEFDEYWEEDYGTVVREWEHEVIASVPNFSQYGDGHYTTTVFYASGATQSTVISFLQEDLSTPIPDITTKPVFSNPSPIQGESFPSSDSITFSWDNSDPGINGLYLERWLDFPDADSEEFAEYWLGDGTFPVDHTDPVSFSPGNWYLDFYLFSGNAKTNADGIHCDTSKGCNSVYSFSVYDSSSAGDHIFMIEAGYGAHYASPTSSVPDEYEFYFEIDTDLTVTNIAVDCPGGHHFNLVDYDEDWEDIDLGIPVRDWETEIPSSVPHWDLFGDGNYTVTVSTVNGSTHTTVVPFLQSDLSSPLPDMTTKPVFTGPDPLQGETFDAVVPITLAWENTDPGVMGVFLERWLNVEDSDDEEIADYVIWNGTYPADHTHPVFFDPGDWAIGFGLFSAIKEPNADGIICDTFKYTAIEYQFSVTDAFSDLDTDRDGLPDLWEEYFYTNIALYGAESDPDGDTLGNLVEFELRSNPRAVDSDGDGVDDAVEVYWGSNPNQASSMVHYVVPTCSSPQAPYTNWATAATNIQDAIDSAIAQDSNMGAIAVTNGTYHLSSQIRAEELVIRSANGPEVTIIDAGGNCRCIRLEDSVINGFTLRNGHAKRGNHWNIDNGGGIRGGHFTAMNCIIYNNQADNVGGGIWGINCTVSDCIISNNSAEWNGGGIFAGGDRDVIDSCVFNANTSRYGGGLAYGMVQNCTFSRNQALYGGGMYQGFAHNCIIWNNTASSMGNNLYGTAATYTCSPDLIPGTDGNITNAPLFADKTNGDFRLQPESPCIDAGNNAYVSVTNDLAGNARIFNGTVDMGAYEFNSSAIDTDADGIPDSWEFDYFDGPGNCAPNTDADDDGHSNFQEYITGMNPTNSASCFVVDTMEADPSGYTINWNAVSGRVYRVFWSTNLVTGFQPVVPEIYYPQNSYTGTLQKAEGFYKLDVRLEP